MPRSAVSLRQEQLQFAKLLRAQHRTWGDVADAFRARYGVNARVAFRLVRGWSQRQAADEWNKRWPADPKTFKNISYWEVWPASTGHAPSLDVLTRLAALYDCRVADLLVDCEDFRGNDAEYQARLALSDLPDIVRESSGTVDGTPVAGYLHGSARMAASEATDSLGAFVERVQEMSAEEVAQAVASWVGQVDPTLSRRVLLLKLSAGLSLAAADPALAFAEGHAEESSKKPSRSRSVGTGLAGIWHSRYIYYSSGRTQEFEGEHYVIFHQHGNQLTGQSLPHSTDSRLQLNLSVDGSVATGSWMEQTSPAGYYRGATYHGTLQLVINPMGREMSGRWVGYGKNFKVNSGEWELTWVDGSTSQRAMRQYHLKV